LWSRPSPQPSPAERFIRTLHGQGFRFVAEVQVARVVQLTEPPALPAAEQRADAGARPSIAVLPFRLVGEAGAQAWTETLAGRGLQGRAA
jgi:DNA-binding winged helix-turn-helix (wHTH) protein